MLPATIPIVIKYLYNTHKPSAPVRCCKYPEPHIAANTNRMDEMNVYMFEYTVSYAIWDTFRDWRWYIFLRFCGNSNGCWDCREQVTSATDARDGLSTTASLQKEAHKMEKKGLKKNTALGSASLDTERKRKDLMDDLYKM